MSAIPNPDTYVWRARLVPALLVLLPLLLAFVAWFPAKFVGWELLITVLGFCGTTALLQQLARDAGRRRQPRLFTLWGGKPSTRALRHRHTHLDPHTLGRYHAMLGAVINLPAPTAAEEIANPAAADQVYESYIRYLLEQTRDRAKYRIVSDENASYGFRRNLWAMKPLGLLCATVGTVASAIPVVLAISSPPPVPLVSAFLSLVLIGVWTFGITRPWVRTTAEAFAVALVAATETLPVMTPVPDRRTEAGLRPRGDR
jgi:hypothetical protein